MQIYLVQHGKSRPKDQDPDQSLSPEGEKEVRRIAETAGDYRVPVQGILHSGKKRAEQTARIMSGTLNPAISIEAAQGLGPLDDVQAWKDKLEELNHFMLVGHLPFMQRLASLLVNGDQDNQVIKFQNGGIICLEKEQGWHIKWTLMPSID
ncbi:phosphohistidine phosphatase, SixA [Desulfonatronospira thiodismutans ASO3-1]|uniref:Phosphohistidine phosphatase, SixA n=1 Tax=Desulfonatronospira thiodismutans ASO3-1 TaxID=555779 RepID=D6SLR6_9BACT|nr:MULTISPECIES: phosphohistidine phosphatase SixA [Desulfonatronospira]EFI35627.1 phosphohistidine phosphatase, SixA [Desulfonatronospira thiodismutans ASO3-1]RQD78487.1 MAG: phosphohistidine phosphatase SixA [Desulfonatronospira sp. MSAO_Bac3]